MVSFSQPMPCGNTDHYRQAQKPSLQQALLSLGIPAQRRRLE